MPSVTLRASQTADSQDETLTEYICDWPNCPNIARHFVGVVPGLRALVILCPEHAKLVAARRQG